MKKKSGLITIVASLALLGVLAVMLFVYFDTRTGSKESQDTIKSKQILVKVITSEEETEDFEIATNAETLRQALDEINLIEGKDGGFGFFMTAVNGRVAEEAKKEWWCITKEGEEVFYGVDEIVIQDGDRYEITLTEGY